MNACNCIRIVYGRPHTIMQRVNVLIEVSFKIWADFNDPPSAWIDKWSVRVYDTKDSEAV